MFRLRSFELLATLSEATTHFTSQGEDRMAVIRSPVQEVAFSVQRRSSAPVNALDVANLHSRFADRYPLFQQVETLGRMELLPNLDSSLQFGVPDNRYWFLSDDAKLLIQFQHDRYSVNWRRLAPSSLPADYPGYPELKNLFLNELTITDQWLEENNRDKEVSLVELYYMNALEIGEARISSALRFYTPASAKSITSFNFSVVKPVNSDNEEPAFLSTTCSIGMDMHGKPVLLVNFTARAATSHTLSTSSAFDLLHSAIIDNLEEVFTSAVLEDFR